MTITRYWPELEEMVRLKRASELIVAAKRIQGLPPDTLPCTSVVVDLLFEEAASLVVNRRDRGGQYKFSYVGCAATYIYLTTLAEPTLLRHTQAIDEIAKYVGVEPKTITRALASQGITSAKQIVSDADHRKRWFWLIWEVSTAFEKLEPSAMRFRSSFSAARGLE